MVPKARSGKPDGKVCYADGKGCREGTFRHRALVLQGRKASPVAFTQYDGVEGACAAGRLIAGRHKSSGERQGWAGEDAWSVALTERCRLGQALFLVHKRQRTPFSVNQGHARRDQTAAFVMDFNIVGSRFPIETYL